MWTTFVFSSQAILARDVVTQPGEKLPVFLIYGTRIGRNRVSSWTVFYLNMTNVLGENNSVLLSEFCGIQCPVPENIHTLPMNAIGNSQGEGVSKAKIEKKKKKEK